MNQRRTKDEPKNSETKKSTFVKISVSFTSLIPSAIPPREHRPTTEKTPTQLPASPKALFLRLSSNKVDFIPEKVDSNPKKVDSFPETIDLSVFKKKSPQKRFLLHIS